MGKELWDSLYNNNIINSIIITFIKCIKSVIPIAEPFSVGVSEAKKIIPTAPEGQTTASQVIPTRSVLISIPPMVNSDFLLRGFPKKSNVFDILKSIYFIITGEGSSKSKLIQMHLDQTSKIRYWHSTSSIFLWQTLQFVAARIWKLRKYSLLTFLCIIVRIVTSL